MNGDVLYENTGNRLSMAAGSDPQPVESSVVPDHNKASLLSSNPLTQSSGVRNHIPYSDHNYGKPLTPPDSCSPEHPEEADTGNEEEGFTRCICGYKHDDGYMICCDKCSAWQHIECVGIKGNSVPETYLCDVCHPRPLDKERAKQIQAKKGEEPSDDDDDDDDDDDEEDSDHDSDGQVIISSNMLLKENIILTKAGKRKKKENTRKLGQKEIKHNKRKRRKRKHISPGSLQVDEDTNGPWSLTELPSERYKEGIQTLYSGDLMKLSFPVSDSQLSIPDLVAPKCNVVDVQNNNKGVVVTEDTNDECFLIECIGNMMLESQFKADHPMFPKYYPFVLYYNDLDHVRLVMNFTKYGNDARYIRRSCSPTAQVRHVIENNKIHLIVVSRTRLEKGDEVTVAFEFPFQDYRKQLECACSQENCVVLKHNSAIQSVEQTNGFRSKDGLPMLDGSFGNHMDSDSEGDNSNDTKEKRNRKKLSREERKLQAYLRQFEKMEKTEKKRQQTSGRDGRTGILTQRNLGDEYNCDTPTKPSKGLRKQGLSQRRKIQAIVRRANRLPSCSSEPHSPEDHYSSTASTPTTPLVNVVEEHNETHDLSEKSFKFPKFKKGSLNDVSSSVGDHRHSNNASPEAECTTTCKQPSLEDRMVDVEVGDGPSCDHLPSFDVTYNGPSSPTTDPIGSPSPSHSSYASPTHSECVDIDQSSRHCIATSPTPHSVACYLLNQRDHKPSSFHTTLKKRWLLKYINEEPANTRPNGLLSSTVGPLNRLEEPQKTFPLPYKRRKLMEHQTFVNNTIISRTIATCAETLQSSPLLTVSPASITSDHAISNLVTSISDVMEPVGSQSSDPRRSSVGSEVSSLRSSLSSISSTEDIKRDRRTSMESVDSTSDVVVPGKPALTPSGSRVVQDSAVEASAHGVSTGETRNTQVGSSVDVPGNTTTAGGKKKVSLSEYRKRSSTSVSKKDSTTVQCTEAPPVTRVSQCVTSVSSSDVTVSSVSNHGTTFSNYGSTLSSSIISSSGTSGGSTGSSGGSVLIEPVSPDESYRADDDDRPKSLHSTSSQDQRLTHVIKDTKSSCVVSDYNPSPTRSSRPVPPETGSSSDAMDIEEDDPSPSSTILVNTPVSYSRPAVLQNNFGKAYPQHDVGKLGNLTIGQHIAQINNDTEVLRRRHGLIPGPQIPSVSSNVIRHQDYYPTNGRAMPPFH